MIKYRLNIVNPLRGKVVSTSDDNGTWPITDNTLFKISLGIVLEKDKER